MRVVQRRCTLYGLLFYRQGDRAGFFFGYCFYGNKVVLLPEAHQRAHSNIHEPKVPLIIHVDVRHLPMRRPSESMTLLWRSSRWGGRGCCVNASRVRFMGFSLPFGGKGALLTALEYSAVRSHQAVGTAGFPLPKESGGRDPSPKVAMVSINPKQLKEKAMYRSS
jgi:hypothetical protein